VHNRAFNAFLHPPVCNLALHEPPCDADGTNTQGCQHQAALTNQYQSV
jgi:hypothetical protein